MGQEIFYCGGCKTLLRSRDLEKGTAVRLDDQVFCAKCAPLPASTPKPGGNKGGDSAQQRISSTRTPRGGVPGGTAKSPVPLILAAVGGIVVVLLLGALAAGGPAPKPPSRREEPFDSAQGKPPPDVAVTPVVEPVRPEPREPRPNPKPIDRESTSKKLLEDARAFLAASPDNLDGALERARRALLEAAGTAVEPDVLRFEEEIRAKQKEKRAAFDALLKDALAKEKFGEALALIEKDKSSDAPVRLALEKAWGDVKDKLFAARKKGAQPEVKALAARAEAWGVAPVREELAKILASPVDVDPPAEVLAWRKKLSELPLPLDYAAALKELEKAPGADKADLEALRLAGEIQRETAFVAPRMKPGQDLRLESVDGEVSGKLLRASAHEFEVLTAEGRISVPAVDITPAGWCELLKAPPRAAQLFRALEGDARPGAEPLPPNILALGERMARQLRTPEEAAARRLFADAEKEFAVPASRLGTAAKYQALAKDATTVFARRAKGIVDERALASQEVYLGLEDMSSGGQFVPSEALKGTSTVTMAGDGRGGESYVQIEATLGESTRAWVYAAACCLETFAIGLQAPDLMGPNPKDPKEQISFAPGAAFALPLRVSTASLRAKHAHPGRELKWFWVPVPLPKYASAGPRTFRLVGEREGLSVAYVWLSIGRPGPPRESEFKEFEKSKPAVEAAAPAKTGTLLREVWNKIPGQKVSDLTAAPGYPDRPSSAGMINLFEGPSDIANDYGTRVRGYLHPPATGDYVFFVATDDDSELWLSLDDTPARKRKISGVNGSTKPREWDHAEAGKSAPIALRAGKRYYVELLHKEAAGLDNLAVGWLLPDGTMERPIPGNRCSPWLGPPGKGGRAFYRGINFNGPALTIDGQSWEGKDAPNVAFEGAAFENFAVPLIPPVSDGPKAQMLRSSIWRKEGLNITVSAVPPGRYFVYAYFWEDNRNEIFDILLNNRVVREKHNSGSAGQWARLGPWPVDVADGKIELSTTGPADANMSGLELWRSTR